MYIPGLNVKLTAPYGLAILRIVLGIAFLVHGWSKLSGGVSNVAGFFDDPLGVPLPGLIAWLVTIVELVGGAFLIIGFLTPIVAILLVIDMVGAIVYRFLGQGVPFIDGGGISWEKEAVFLASAVCLFLAGPGAWSVDDIVIDTRKRP